MGKQPVNRSEEAAAITRLDGSCPSMMLGPLVPGSNLWIRKVQSESMHRFLSPAETALAAKDPQFTPPLAWAETPTQVDREMVAGRTPEARWTTDCILISGDVATAVIPPHKAAAGLLL